MKTTAPVSQSDLDRDRLIELKRFITSQVKAHGIGSFGWARAVLGKMDTLIGREKRIMFLTEMMGHPVESSRDLSEAELFAILMWATPTKTQAGVSFSSIFLHDLTILQKRYNGQQEFPDMV